MDLVKNRTNDARRRKKRRREKLKFFVSSGGVVGSWAAAGEAKGKRREGGEGRMGEACARDVMHSGVVEWAVASQKRLLVTVAGKEGKKTRQHIGGS